MAKHYTQIDPAAARIEVALRDACIGDAWSPAQLRCITDARTAPAAEKCLLQLSTTMREELGERIQKAHRAERRQRRGLDCATFVRHPAAWYDLAAIRDPDERAFIARLIPALLAHSHCDGHAAIERAGTCFAAAATETAVAECIPDGVREDVAAYIDRVRASIGKRTPPSCIETAAHYHSHERWWEDRSGRLHGTAGERATDDQLVPNLMRATSARDQASLIAKAREAVATACERERWPARVRSCIAGTWTNDQQAACLVAIDGSYIRARRYHAPPLELVQANMPGCDAYLAAARALLPCQPNDAIEAALDDAARWAARNLTGAGAPRNPGACAEGHREVAAATAHCR